MRAKPKLSADGRTVTVRVPISIRRRGGRKLVLAPDGRNVTAEPVTRHVDNAMVKTIARAFRWRQMLESGQYATIREIASAEKINETYVGRVLRLQDTQAILDRDARGDDQERIGKVPGARPPRPVH